jgi:hypothetical protein
MYSIWFVIELLSHSRVSAVTGFPLSHGSSAISGISAWFISRLACVYHVRSVIRRIYSYWHSCVSLCVCVCARMCVFLYSASPSEGRAVNSFRAPKFLTRRVMFSTQPHPCSSSRKKYSSVDTQILKILRTPVVSIVYMQSCLIPFSSLRNSG